MENQIAFALRQAENAIPFAVAYSGHDASKVGVARSEGEAGRPKGLTLPRLLLASSFCKRWQGKTICLRKLARRFCGVVL